MTYLYSFGLLFGGLFVVNFIFSYQGKHIEPQFWSTLKFQLLMLPFFLMANLSIGYGVKYGLKSSGNLSFTLVAAKCLEILISLIMGYLFLKEFPNWKNWVGFVIIVIGLFLVKQK